MIVLIANGSFIINDFEVKPLIFAQNLNIYDTSDQTSNFFVDTKLFLQ